MIGEKKRARKSFVFEGKKRLSLYAIVDLTGKRRSFLIGGGSDWKNGTKENGGRRRRRIGIMKD